VPLLPILVLICAAAAAAEEFAGEPFLEGSSVANNGTSSAIPSRLRTATQFLEYPADFGDAKTFRVEMATLPLFGNLAESWNGALAYNLDARTQLSVFGKMEITPDIESRPLLRGSREDRLNDPGFRPAVCDGCNAYSDHLYMAAINLMRVFHAEFPRIDIASREIPMEFGIGVTAKYYLEEIVGPQNGDYFIQNLNLDAGASMKFLWGWDPIARKSDRDIKIQFAGLEVLPTSQTSDIAGQNVYEDMSWRWRMSADWAEGFPEWSSILTVGITQKSEGGSLPAFGAEWDFKDMVFVRAGKDDEFISGGMSLAWRWISVHYALRYHELGTSLYQVSGQVSWP
jgi:hypothetical protein